MANEKIGIREILIILAFIFMAPLLIKLIIFSFNPTDTELMGDILVGAVTPWWTDLIITLSGWGTFGTIIILLLLWVISKNKDLA